MKHYTRYSALFLTKAALIAALYVVLSMLSESVRLCSGVIQCRFSEALTILPAFMPESIPGLYIGCLLTNILNPQANPWDIAFGPVATLIGAVGTYLIGRAVRKAAGKKLYTRTFLRIVVLTAMFALPPILANAAIIPPILKFAYGYEGGYWFFVLTVGAGEIIACGVFGGILLSALLGNRYTRQLLLTPPEKAEVIVKKGAEEKTVTVALIPDPEE